jgi:hypothetical protein
LPLGNQTLFDNLTTNDLSSLVFTRWSWLQALLVTKTNGVLQAKLVNLAINFVNCLAFAPAKGLTSRCPAGHGKGKRQGYQTSFDYQGGITSEAC